eukprot:6645827-Alexandrium_andersonii.AAC.1
MHVQFMLSSAFCQHLANAVSSLVSNVACTASHSATSCLRTRAQGSEWSYRQAWLLICGHCVHSVPLLFWLRLRLFVGVSL